MIFIVILILIVAVVPILCRDGSQPLPTASTLRPKDVACVVATFARSCTSFLPLLSRLVPFETIV